MVDSICRCLIKIDVTIINNKAIPIAKAKMAILTEGILVDSGVSVVVGNSTVVFTPDVIVVEENSERTGVAVCRSVEVEVVINGVVVDVVCVVCVVLIVEASVPPFDVVVVDFTVVVVFVVSTCVTALTPYVTA